MSYLYQPPTPIYLPVPHFPQKEESDCLVACTAMVLQYIGRPAARRRLVRILRTKSEGTYFPNLDRLDRLNVHVFRQQGTIENLYNALNNNHPCIVAVQTAEFPHWQGYRSDHAVVVTGMESDAVIINDPAFPNPSIRVPMGDFDLAWFEGRKRYAVLVPL